MAKHSFAISFKLDKCSLTLQSTLLTRGTRTTSQWAIKHTNSKKIKYKTFDLMLHFLTGNFNYLQNLPSKKLLRQ